MQPCLLVLLQLGARLRQTLRQKPPNAMTVAPRLEKFARFLLRGLRIGASTVSIIELLRSDWTGGITAGVAWFVFVQVERRLPPPPADEAPS